MYDDTDPHVQWCLKEFPPAERRLLACLLSHSALMPRVFDVVRSLDFTSTWGQRVYEEMIARRQAITGIQPVERIAILAHHLAQFDVHAHAKLEAVYSVGLYSPPQLVPNAVAAEHFALAVVESARDRYQQTLIEARQFGAEELERLVAYQQRIERAGIGRSYLDVGLSGTRLLQLSNEPIPDPVVPGLLWPAHVNVLAGRTKIGKTFLVCHVLLSLALQRHPWTGKSIPSLDDPPRILMLSRDDTTVEIARRFRVLDPRHPEWADWIVVVGKELRPQPLDAEGLTVLRATLEAARAQDCPFGGVVFDPYTHFLPAEGKLNEDETASRIIVGLESVCTDFGCWCWILHHLRKRPAQRRELEDEELLDEIRGSGAIANLARAIAFLEKREPHLRRLVAFSNVGPTPRPALLQVCDEGKDEIVRWTPVSSTASPPGELFGPDEEFTFADYCRRRLGIPYPQKPSQAQRRLLFPDLMDSLSRGWIRTTEKRKNAQWYALDGPERQSAAERCRALRPAEGAERSERPLTGGALLERPDAPPSAPSQSARAPNQMQLRLSAPAPAPPHPMEENDDDVPY